MSSETVTIQIPRDVLRAARMTTDELRVELALHLYATRRLGVGKARKLAGLTLWDFRRLTALRRIPINYGIEEFEKDLKTINKLHDEDDI